MLPRVTKGRTRKPGEAGSADGVGARGVEEGVHGRSDELKQLGSVVARLAFLEAEFDEYAEMKLAFGFRREAAH